MLKIPFFSNKQKIWVGPLGIVAFMVFCMIPNHVHIFEPSLMYMFDFEKRVPFIDWTVWIYMSDYLYIGLVFFLLRERYNMNRIYYSQIMMLIFSMFIFMLYPTMFPRPEVEYHGFSGQLVALLHSLDSPCNAFPSIHVSMTFLAGFGFIKERKVLFSIFMLWAVLISISTLTLKQHYLLDVLAGFVMAILFYWVGSRIRDRRI
ncbi:MAG TPA: phosphatase PAP2 family protein [bacterium]|nr:phosphatase PAP2 family protein [bacterium]